MGKVNRVLKVEDIRFKHKKEEKEILKGISFSLKSGEIVAILGPNGSGKSTLLKCIMGIWRPYRGKIYLNGEDITLFPFLKRTKFFAFVPQEHKPAFPYTVFDVVLMGRAGYVGMFSLPSNKDKDIVMEAISILGISYLKERNYTKISGGERQLVLIARALAQSSPFLLLDEPVSHLDFKNQVKVMCKIKELTDQKGLSVLVNLHDPNLASLFADRIVMLKDGKIISEGPAHRVITKSMLKKLYEMKVDIVSNNGYKLVAPVLEKQRVDKK